MQPFFKSLLVTSLIATAGFASYAQSTATPMPHHPTEQNSGAGERGSRMGMMGKMDPEKRKAMMAKHVQALKAKLKITAAQEGAWITFTTALHPAEKMEHKRPDRAEMDKLTTPERIDKMRELRKQHMGDMQTAMDKRDDAIKTFYAVLTPEQQKVFDTEHARMGMHHGEKHGMQGDGSTNKRGQK